MALLKDQLAQAIKAAFMEAKTKEDGTDAAFAALSDEIATAIDTYIKQLQITYTSGLTAPNGPVAGVFRYTLS